MIAILVVLILAAGLGVAVRRWQRARFSSEWWRDQTRRELHTRPEAAPWQWGELVRQDRQRQAEGRR